MPLSATHVERMNSIPLISKWALLLSLLTAASWSHAASHQETILKANPAAYWRLNDQGGTVRNLAPSSKAGTLDGTVEGKVELGQPGQDRESFPEFEPDSTAAAFSGKGSYVRVKDPGANSPLDFAKGDTLTIEAWVFLNQLKDGQNVYVVGKGRTGNKGFAPDNQNWALRLRENDGAACVSFLFRNEHNRRAPKEAVEKDWHRWTSKTGFAPNSGWHHVAVTYTFGKSASIKGYIDGTEVKGDWDMGGKTEDGPVVDDDDVWIGSSMGGSAGNSFNGLINEVAIYRHALSARDIKARFVYVPVGPKIAARELPKDAVLVELFDTMGASTSWNFSKLGEPTETWTEPAMAFSQLPQKYNARGVRVDRGSPFLVRASAAVTVPKGEHRVLLRTLQSARLFMDGKLLAVTKFIVPNGSGHGDVTGGPGADWPVGLRHPRSGHNDEFITVQFDGKPHVFVLEAFIGGKGLRPETGELSVSVELPPRMASLDALQGVQLPAKLFSVLSPKNWVPLTDEGWSFLVSDQLQRVTAMERERRTQAAAAEQTYWTKRHEIARTLLASQPPVQVPATPTGMPAHNEIDRFIGARLAAAKVTPPPLTDDYAFLRRVALDTTGVPPTPEDIRLFLNDKSPDRRARAIDRFLASPRWADHWVSYWQDVLAENPAILKPTLNNTGPFRYWIYESFLDNKPMDRFASELILMEGSVYGGGPGGFGVATQNDVPMADRAQIVSQAFLAMNLQCARCHDAPYHDFKQKDLFSIAAMLKQGVQEVPKSSSIPANANIQVGRLVNVTLKPGEKVPPAWSLTKSMHDELAADVLRDADNTRERLAAYITDARNERFSRVLANRLWQRYLGRGIVEPVDDWESSKASHPELLDWLARELAAHDFDLKHVARLILNSHTYQRVAGLHTPASDEPKDRLFASPARRRLTAEQVVDSLFAAVGKDMTCEMLTLDNDCRRSPKDFLNLGYPRRAWEFTSLSNDRDRPALSMPRTQEIVDILAMFGWREARQNGLSVRDDSPNVLQPASVSNSGLSNGRIARLTDDAALTQISIESKSLDELVQRTFLRLLSRPPTAEESKALKAHLERGFAERVKPASPESLKREFDRSLLLSWSNHLNAKATEIMMDVENRARLGDEPTARLDSDWRERMEDAAWALINTPEFVFVP